MMITLKSSAKGVVMNIFTIEVVAKMRLLDKMFQYGLKQLGI